MEKNYNFESLLLKDETLFTTRFDSKPLEKYGINTVGELLSADIDSLSFDSRNFEKDKLRKTRLKGLIDLLKHKYMGCELVADVYLDYMYRRTPTGAHVVEEDKLAFCKMGLTQAEVRDIHFLSWDYVKDEQLKVIELFKKIRTNVTDRRLDEKISIYINYYNNKNVNEECNNLEEINDKILLRIILEEEKKLLLELSSLNERYLQITERLTELQTTKEQYYKEKYHDLKRGI